MKRNIAVAVLGTIIMMKYGYLFFVLLTLHKEVASQLRIVNGYEAKRDDFPYQASVQMHNRIYCGGFIVDNYHVLTAAHCVEGSKPNIFSVVVGSINLNVNTGTRYRVTNIKMHKDYQEGNGWPNDIALLRVATPITFSRYVGAAVLPKPNEQYKDGQLAVISGFGQLNTQSKLSPKLYKTEVFIESNDKCKRFYNTFSEDVRPTNICTRNTKRVTGFCSGDSGGPLTVKGKVVGIVSFSTDGCAGISMDPQVYTRVSKYIDWINYWRKH